MFLQNYTIQWCFLAEILLLAHLHVISFVLCYHGNQLDFDSKNISGSFPLTRGRSWLDFKLLLELVQILWLLYCFSKFTINSIVDEGDPHSRYLTYISYSFMIISYKLQSTIFQALELLLKMHALHFFSILNNVIFLFLLPISRNVPNEGFPSLWGRGGSNQRHLGGPWLWAQGRREGVWGRSTKKIVLTTPFLSTEIGSLYTKRCVNERAKMKESRQNDREFAMSCCLHAKSDDTKKARERFCIS